MAGPATIETPEAFEKYPISTVFAFQGSSILLYAIGIYLTLQVNALLAGLFVLLSLYGEIGIYREGCVSCYYFGKRCMSGRGVIAAMLLKKADPKKFCEKQVTWKNLLPMVLVSMAPILAGAYLLLQAFTWPVLILVLYPILLWFVGNQILYGKLGCPHCKQGRICCPANEFFGKKTEKKS